MPKNKFIKHQTPKCYNENVQPKTNTTSSGYQNYRFQFKRCWNEKATRKTEKEKCLKFNFHNCHASDSLHLTAYLENSGTFLPTLHHCTMHTHTRHLYLFGFFFPSSNKLRHCFWKNNSLRLRSSRFIYIYLLCSDNTVHSITVCNVFHQNFDLQFLYAFFHSFSRISFKIAWNAHSLTSFISKRNVPKYGFGIRHFELRFRCETINDWFQEVCKISEPWRLARRNVFFSFVLLLVLKKSTLSRYWLRSNK